MVAGSAPLPLPPSRAGIWPACPGTSARPCKIPAPAPDEGGREREKGADPSAVVYLYDHLAGDKEVGGGGKDPKRVRITKRKTMQETPRHIVLKSNRSMESHVFVGAICVNQFGIVHAWACVCVCIYVRMVILSSRYCFPHAPR